MQESDSKSIAWSSASAFQTMPSVLTARSRMPRLLDSGAPACSLTEGWSASGGHVPLRSQRHQH